MRIFFKLLLLSAITLFALFNYRVLSFDKGISKMSMENKSVIEVLNTVANIKSVEYYKLPFTRDEQSSQNRPDNYQSSDYNYRVYIVTNDEAYLLSATLDQINSLNTLDIFSKSLKPNKISPIPYYVEIILGLIIIFFPFGKRKEKKKEA